ncbi:hypothetical protein JTB14_037154 [Gonioctena quinquepunctata]|nr:hypothetical protein JTB14_037154 [Gonioctena quinquepunctata]
MMVRCCLLVPLFISRIFHRHKSRDRRQASGEHSVAMVSWHPDSSLGEEREARRGQIRTGDLILSGMSMPGSWDSLDIDAKKGAVGFGNVLMSYRDYPSGGDSLEKEIGQDEFLAPPGVKAGWI